MCGAFFTLLIAFSHTEQVAAQQFSSRHQTRLVEMAELLGAVHHLRRVCHPNEDQAWRNAMVEMINTENPPGWLRKKMIGRFNAGFHREQQSFPNCTAASRQKSVSLANEGANLARRLSNNSSR
jgi:uncharacterized protein (TIGR02301 family)